jgi:hypothetical protein
MSNNHEFILMSHKSSSTATTIAVLAMAFLAGCGKPECRQERAAP